MNDGSQAQELIIPNCVPGENPVHFDMTSIYSADGRLGEVSRVTPNMVVELMSTFNNACNLASKIHARIIHQILLAEKNLDRAKAVVILDKMPEELIKRKSKGSKEFRDALIAQDPECEDKLDTLNLLKAAKELVNGYIKSFDRAYSACKIVSNNKNLIGNQPQFGGSITGHFRAVDKKDTKEPSEF